MAQLAMAWVISNPDVSTAITGASRVEQLKDTVKSLEVLPKLTAEVQKRIEDIFESQPTSKNDHKTFGPFPNRRRDVLKYWSESSCYHLILLKILFIQHAINKLSKK